MTRPYDDDRYLEWFNEFNRLVNEFLDTEGNTRLGLEAEFENAVANVEIDDDGVELEPAS